MSYRLAITLLHQRAFILEAWAREVSIGRPLRASYEAGAADLRRAAAELEAADQDEALDDAATP